MMPLIGSVLFVMSITTDDHWIAPRIMKHIRLLLVCQLLLGWTCVGFLQDLTVTKSYLHQHHTAGNQKVVTSSSSCSTSFLTMVAQPSSSEKSNVKPPRFAQKAHSSSSLSSIKKKGSGTSKSPSKATTTKRATTSSSSSFRALSESEHEGRRPVSGSPSKLSSSSLPFNTERSIEDMEERLMKRWGTLEQPSSGSRSGESKHQQPQRRLSRPVLDPWEMAETTNRRRPQTVVQEFYDEDDEGFEIMELDDDDDGEDDDEWEIEEGYDEISNTKKNPRMKITHLISPKPVGGRGTMEPVEEEAASQSSYFFNPNKPRHETSAKATTTIKTTTTTTTTTNAVSNKERTAPADVSRTSTEKVEKISTTKTKAPMAQPLLDDAGNERYLTLAEAQRLFEASSSDQAAVEAMTDEDDAPIVAYQQSAQLSWNSIGITSEVLLSNLDAMYCSNPLAVQQKTIPHFLTGSDVLVGMYTGSGKTLSFLTPLIQRLLWQEDDEDTGLAVIIVAPGRELASQIVSVARKLLEGTSHKVQLAIGGTTFTRNLEQIRKQKPSILVGTPGRIAELVVGKPGEKSGRLKINNLQSLVLDEFDALLEYKPHAEPTRAILDTLQRRHGTALQSIFCSATASDLMDSPKVTQYLRPGFATALADDDDVFVTATTTAGSSAKKRRPQVSKTVLHGVVHVPHRRFAIETIRRILHTDPVPQQILIFVESSRKVEIVVEKLGQQGIIAAPLHGGKNSDKMDRADVSKALREGYVGIVVATEMAARGLDAPLLTHVINMDLPTDASHYAHRAGRCGRGGRPGIVINMTTCPKERKVPQRFSDTLGIDLYTVEPRNGKLLLVDPETQSLDES